MADTSPSSCSSSSRSCSSSLFWMVHVLPEKIAHKRHHPQFEAIKTLCLLSLVFGGLLWPHRLAVGLHQAGRLQAGLRHRQASRLLQGARPARAGERHRRHTAARRRCSRSAGCRPATSTPFAPTWQRSRRGWPRPTPDGGALDGSPPARHLRVLRLADLHQAASCCPGPRPGRSASRSSRWSPWRR